MRLPLVLAAAIGVTLLAAGCAGEPYNKRMAFLDEVSKRGIEYRENLRAQKTAPSAAACEIGWKLLDAKVPNDTGDPVAGPTREWEAQAKEGYVKSCMTGEMKPKPDPSGVKAVTPVPIPSVAPVKSA